MAKVIDASNATTLDVYQNTYPFDAGYTIDRVIRAGKVVYDGKVYQVVMPLSENRNPWIVLGEELRRKGR